jgi:hypothetical protein
MDGWMDGNGNSKASYKAISKMNTGVSTENLSSLSVKSILVFSEHETYNML